MAKKFKLRYLIISFLIIAIVTACTAFSVSYASWIVGENEFTVGAVIGDWDSNTGGNTDWDNVSEGFDLGNGYIVIMQGVCWNGGWWDDSSGEWGNQSNIGIYFLVNKGAEISFRFKGYLIIGDKSEEDNIGDYAAVNKDGMIFDFRQCFEVNGATYDSDKGLFTFQESGYYYVSAHMEFENSKGDFHLKKVESTNGSGYIDLTKMVYVYNGAETDIDLVPKN